MPLHDLSYQRFEGARTARWARIWALARSSGLVFAQKRSFLLLMVLCWLPVIVRAVLIFLANRFPQAATWVSVSPGFWQEFLAQQVVYLPVLLVALYTGAAAISTDLATGAFVIYLSKPLSRFDYLLAKAIPVLAAILLVTLVPGLLLLVMDLSLAEDFTLVTDAPYLPLAIAGYALWITVFFTLVVLAVSSLSRSGRVAGAGFVALTLGSRIVFAVSLARLRLREPPTFLSMVDAAIDSGHLFFGTPSYGDSPYLAAGTMVFFMVVSVVVLSRRLSSAEVSS